MSQSQVPCDVWSTIVDLVLDQHYPYFAVEGTLVCKAWCKRFREGIDRAIQSLLREKRTLLVRLGFVIADCVGFGILTSFCVFFPGDRILEYRFESGSPVIFMFPRERWEPDDISVFRPNLQGLTTDDTGFTSKFVYKVTTKEDWEIIVSRLLLVEASTYSLSGHKGCAGIFRLLFFPQEPHSSYFQVGRGDLIQNVGQKHLLSKLCNRDHWIK